MKHTHPVTILFFFLRLAYLLVLPLLQRLFAQGPGAVTGMRQELALAGLLLAFSVLRWRRLVWKREASGLTVRSGVLFRRETWLPLRRIASVDIEDGVLLHLIGARRIRVAVDGPGRKKEAATLLLTQRDALAFRPMGPASKKRAAGLGEVALCAASASSFALGLLLAAPVVERVGTLLNLELRARLLGTVTQAQAALSRYLPPALSALAYLMAAGYLIGVLYLAARTAGFFWTRHDDWWRTRRGLIARHETALQQAQCKALVVRRTPVMRLFGRGQLQAVCAGYGAQRGELPLLIPAGKLPVPKMELRVPARAKFRCFLPLLPLSIALTVLAAYGILWFGSQKRLIALLLVLPGTLLFLLPFPLRDRMLHSGISGDFSTVRTTRRFTQITALLPDGQLGAVICRSSPGQRELGVCDVTLVSRTTLGARYTARNLDEKKVAERLKTIGSHSSQNVL